MIRITNLTKRFGAVVAVDGVSLDVPPGEAVALLGPNGSGKTTTLKCLTGLARPDGGQVSIAGRDMQREPKQARGQLSFLPQRVAFPDNLTAWEIMRFYCTLRELAPDRIDPVLSAAGLAPMKAEPLGRFSGGMVQRLGLAVALLADAPILILDEPTASLDPEGIAAFRELVVSQKQRGRTVLFSTHVLADVELLADRAAILVGGKLAAVESVRVLREGLASAACLRVELREPDRRFARAASLAGASDAELVGSTLWVACQPEQRLSVLHAIESAGGAVERFSTVEPTLEEIYLRYVNANHADPAGADFVELRDALHQAG